MLRCVSINAFVMCHTRLIRSTHPINPAQMNSVAKHKNILKNILKKSENCPLNGMWNSIFHFTHQLRTGKSYVDMNFLFIVPSIHH
jgi:hypothetical protein